MRVLVSGSIQWGNADAIRREFDLLPAASTIVHGDCDGADALAGAIAKTEYGFTVEKYTKNDEDYKKYKRGAWKGLNERMLEMDIELVLCFHEQIEKSNGTRHMAELAATQNVPTKLITG